MDWTINHIAIVIFPLKALMRDQVVQHGSYGIRAVSVDPETATETFNGKSLLIFVRLLKVNINNYKRLRN